MNIFNCIELRNKIEAKIKDEIDRIDVEKDGRPSLCVVMVGDNPASIAYVKNKRKACERVGINFVLQTFERDVPQKYIEDYIREANYKYDGVMVQLPLPVGYDTDKILSCISPLKDVDGLTLANKMRLYTDNSAYVPCTARGVLELLDEFFTSTHDDYKNNTFCVIGRSDLVGRPLAHEIQRRNGTVTVCHSKTPTNALRKTIDDADIVISATGHIIDTDLLSLCPLAYIDCGYSFVDGKAHGDVSTDYLESYNYDGWVTTTPRGTGVLTVSALLENVMDSYNHKVS
jgi:methylenetetrahydrofolate dehydrogenase (NADP+)/methenyltetrahydrofolate cyclohydrolase